MEADLPQEVADIIKKVEKEGFKIYIVGGAVRDILLGRPLYDWDFTTNATPEEIVKIFKAEDPFYDNKFGTVGIPSEDEELRPFEITTFRTEEGYSDKRRPDKVKWGKNLKEDIKRRDFTINAMALKKIKDKEFKLIDHFNGQKDLKDKLIRTVGDPTERFSEDALRMMRAIRIASEIRFLVEHDTFEAIKMNASSINKISKERVRDELLKILASPNPYEGMMMFRNSGLMDQTIPEFIETFGVEQKSPGRHHIHDVGTHSLLSLKECKSTDPIVRFATMIHDIGKPKTYKKTRKGIITFYNHEVVGARIAKNIAKRLRFSKKQTNKLYKLVRWHQFTLEENQSDKAIKRFIRKVGIENVDDMLDLRVGDRLGGGARETSWRLERFKKRLVEVQKEPFTVHDLKISGDDVMKELSLSPGPKVGEILQKLFKEVENQAVPNEKKALLKKLKQLGTHTT